MQTVKIRISLIKGNFARIHDPDLCRYTAEVIKDNGQYYYRVDDTTIEITPLEAKRVTRNSRLYYFSTALWLHLQIQRKEGFY